MHICSVITSFTTGGAEILVCGLSRHFVEAGHEASIIALSDAKSVGNSPETEKRMIEGMRAQGVFATSLGLDGKRSILKGRRALSRYLEQRPPDLLHLHTARAALMAGFGNGDMPKIFTHHNSRLSFPRHLYRLFDQFVYSYVGISSVCASQTRQHARRPVRLIRNGSNVCTSPHAPRERPSKTPTIVAVGAISDQKDYPALISAAKLLFPQFEASGQSFNLKIVGGGEQLSLLRGLVKSQGLDRHVHLLGERNDVPELLSSADLFVNSSRYEGLPLAIIEALMSALPIVATKVAGNTELVRHAQNGLLVPQSDPEAMASAIGTILETPELYSKLSHGALASSKDFTIERCASEHLKLYQEALSSSTRRQAA